MEGSAGLSQDPCFVVTVTQEARMSDLLGSLHWRPRLLPRGFDLASHRLLDLFFPLLLDLLWITEYQTVVNLLLFLLLSKGFLVENVWISIGELFTVDDIFRKLCKPSLRHSFPGLGSCSS